MHSDACEDFLLINQHALLECLREIPLIIACGSLTLAGVSAQAWLGGEPSDVEKKSFFSVCLGERTGSPQWHAEGEPRETITAFALN